MKKFKSIFIVVLLISAISLTTSAQKYSDVKIKTSAQSKLCKTNIENAIAYERGVKDCSLDLKSKVLTVKYKTKKNNADNIRKAVTKLGYDADGMCADAVAYNKLPKQCKKPVKKSNSKSYNCRHNCGSKAKSGCGSK